jgi:HD-like signal output (HDOD) protein/CheY-like chemotaxis protein
VFEDDSRRRRILFVDNELYTRPASVTMLFPLLQDWDIVSVTGADAAFQALAIQRFDVLMAEMPMHTDGAEFLNQAMNLDPEMVRLVLSERTGTGTSVRLAKAAHQCLRKPCDPGILKTTLARIFALRHMLTGNSLKRLVSGMSNLPSLPGAYQTLIETLDSPTAGASEIGELIIHDIAMTAKVLQLANSAFFGIPRRVTDPLQAIQYLGVETLKALVLTSGVFSQFKGPRIPGLSVEQLQQHSLDTARVARMIALRLDLEKELVDDAFLAGLLHDAGKLILITKDAEMYERSLAIVRNDRLPLDRVEREVFGADHAEVGSYLFWLWALPRAVSEAVGFHHRPADCPAQGVTAFALVHVADALVHEVPAEQSGWPQLDLDYLASTGLADRIPEWRQMVEDTLMERSV